MPGKKLLMKNVSRWPIYLHHKVTIIPCTAKQVECMLRFCFTFL